MSTILSVGSSRHKKALLYVLSVFLIVLLSGCSTVDPKPFTMFNAVANELTTIDAIVDAHTSTVKEREMGKISQDQKATKNLALNFDVDDPFKYEFKFTNEERKEKEKRKNAGNHNGNGDKGIDKKEPLFIKWQRLDFGLTELNASFIEYTSLLAALADGDLIKTEDFDQLAADLNGNLRNALKSLGNEPDESKLALFSTAASAGAHAYISNKRKESLIEIINDNQDSVDAFIQHARDAVEILATEIQAENVESYEALIHQWGASSPPGNKRAIADKIYGNSKITGMTLDMLKSLDKTYQSLAETHKKLAIGLESDQFSVSDLTANIKRLQKLYKDLKEANEMAEKAAAQANQAANKSS
jgi:outer membrane murein-binding lipoprotein Lpp